MEYYRIMEERRQEKLDKQMMRRKSVMKFGEILGKAVLETAKAVGEIAITSRQAQEKQQEELVALKNKEIEREYKANSIIRGDIDNLRNHVAKIVQQADTPEDVKEKGKKLLKSESDYWFGPDTYTCDKYYKFVIEHGL